LRIIGGHDYYDVALSTGFSTDLMFVRNRENRVEAKDGFHSNDQIVIDINGKEYVLNRNRDIYSAQQEFPPEIKVPGRIYRVREWHGEFKRVIFAGKLYRGYLFFKVDVDTIRPRYNWIDQADRLKEVYVWSEKDLDKFLSTEFKGATIKRCPANFFQEDNAKASRLLVDNKASIAILDKTDKGKYIWRFDDSGLSEIKFVKALDPFTAFQELSMWLGNLAGPERPMVKITDEKTLVKKHGMDKWSFKTIGKHSKV